jgi:ubiquinone/menaquinone biosynthesis C-methylase UbiE
MSTLSVFYDFYDGPEYRQDQFNFYVSLFDPQNGELLELACGTGIITIELARRGFRITGFDYDEDMLSIASRKHAAEDPQIQRRTQFQLGDMKDFAVDKQFGAVIIPTNSFGYLHKLEDRRSCLKHVYDHLLPNGTLVIEEKYLSPERLAHMSNLRGIERTWESRVNPETGKYTMFKDCILKIDSMRETIFRTSFIDEIQDDGSIKRYVSTNAYFGDRSHYFDKIELQSLVESCGFKVKEVWGDFSKRPFASKSNSIIILADKVNSADKPDN